MRVAILGFGKVAESTHLPGLALARPPHRVVAVAEPSPERRARARELLPHASLHERAEDLLARERGVDLALVAAPPFLHVPLAVAALRAGVHVLCEKPLALEADGVEAVAAAAREAGRVAFTVNNWRHAPLVDAAVRLARSGELGALRDLAWSVRRKEADPGSAAPGRTWREDPRLALGGVLVDHGWHALTIVHALLGAGPSRVRARVREEPGKPDVEARVWLERAGARAFLRLTWRACRRSNRARLVFERGAARLEDDRLVRAGAKDLVFAEKLSKGSVHPEWFPGVLGELHDEVAGRAPRGRSLEEARWCAATIRAAYASARAGGAVVDVV